MSKYAGYNSEEVSDFKLNLLQEEFQQKNILKKELIAGKAFVLENILTKKECKYYIEESEKAGYLELGSKYRTNDRVIIISEELSSLLFERIKPFLPLTITVTSDQSHEFANQDPSSVSSVLYSASKKFEEGEWRLKELGEIWRFCRYQKGGFFKAHLDGSQMKSAHFKSFLTVNIYLNDTIGGNTNFITDHYQNIEERKIIASVHPSAGSALIFFHPILHEGDVLDDGVKYLLRSDVMYERVSELNDEMAIAYSYIEIANNLDAQGKYSEAVQYYRKAFKLCPSLENQV